MDLSADAAVFFNASEFAEPVTYVPHGGAQASINAIVDRNPLQPRDAGGGRKVPQGTIEIEIANHATLGRTSIKERFDRVIVKEETGGASKTYTVAKILAQDSGSWRLELSA